MNVKFWEFFFCLEKCVCGEFKEKKIKMLMVIVDKVDCGVLLGFKFFVLVDGWVDGFYVFVVFVICWFCSLVVFIYYYEGWWCY